MACRNERHGVNTFDLPNVILGNEGVEKTADIALRIEEKYLHRRIRAFDFDGTKLDVLRASHLSIIVTNHRRELWKAELMLDTAGGITVGAGEIRGAKSGQLTADNGIKLMRCGRRCPGPDGVGNQNRRGPKREKEKQQRGFCPAVHNVFPEAAIGLSRRKYW